MKEHTTKPKSQLKGALIVSLVAHLLLIAILFLSSDFEFEEDASSGQMVEAVVIDPNLVRQQAQQIRQQKEKAQQQQQDKLEQLKKQAEELEKNRKAEEERVRQLQLEKAKAEKQAREAKERKLEQERLEKQKAAEKAEREKAAKEAAEKAAREKAAKEAAEKAAREKAAKEAAEKAAREKAAKEAAQKAAREKQETEQALDSIFDGLEAESSQNSAAKQRQVNNEVSKYSTIYKQLIQNKLIAQDYLKGKTCRVNMKLISAGNGFVVGNVAVLSGDSRLCSATKSAITQVANFPAPKDPDVINKLKDINLTVEL